MPRSVSTRDADRSNNVNVDDVGLLLGRDDGTDVGNDEGMVDGDFVVQGADVVGVLLGLDDG
jgi:hypothetical protein